MAYPDKIKNYAKDLYLELDDAGNRKYSFAKIAAKICEKFRQNLSGETVSQWAKEGSWEITLQDAKYAGQAKAVAEGMTREEEIKEALSNDVAERRKWAKDTLKLTSYLKLKALQTEAEKVKTGGEMTMDIRDIEYMAKNAEEAINTLDGIDTGGDNKVKELVDAIRGL